MQKVIDFLSGYKTYIVSAAAALTAIGAYASGQIGLNELVVAIFAALGGASMRAAVAKTKQA